MNQRVGVTTLAVAFVAAGCTPPAVTAQPNYLPPTVHLAPLDTDVPTTSQRPAYVRVVHASPDHRESATLALAIDDPTAFFKRDLAYLDANRYVQMSEGDHFLFVNNPTVEDASAQLLRTQTPTLRSGRFYTLVLYGRPGEDPPFEAEMQEDEITAIGAGRLRLKFFHAMATSSSLDLCVANAPGGSGNPLFSGVSYASWGQGQDNGREIEFASTDPIDFQLRASSPRRCTGAILAELRFSISVPAHLTAIAVGRDNSRNAPKQLIVCAGAPNQTVCARSRAR